MEKISLSKQLAVWSAFTRTDHRGGGGGGFVNEGPEALQFWPGFCALILCSENQFGCSILFSSYFVDFVGFSTGEIIPTSHYIT